MKNTGQAYSDNDAQEKSFRRWWDRLTEHSWQLFKANLCYLPFVLPAYVCIVVFFIFNAWLFFLAGLILIIPVGPAMLTLYEVTVNIAAGRPRDELPRFFSAYRIRWRHGLVLSFVLLAACVIVVYPVYFALVTNSEMKVMIVACAVTAALLLCSLLPHYSSLVISKERSGLLRNP
jgi:hypothetical protein